MEPIVIRTLAKALGKQDNKKNRAALVPGDYEVDETVGLHVRGTVKILEDEDYIPTAEIPMIVTLALFMRYAGVTGEHAMNALTKAMEEALELSLIEDNDEKKAKLAAIRETADIEEAEAAVIKKLGDLPEKTRAGKVIVKAVADEVPIRVADLKGLAKATPEAAPKANTG